MSTGSCRLLALRRVRLTLGVLLAGGCMTANQQVTGRLPPDVPQPRSDPNSLQAHRELVEKTKKGRIDVYFVGDSIVRRWGATDYPHLLANWKQNFFGWNAANFGWGGDRTQNILWRLQNGELDGVNPKVVVLAAGTNNIGDASAAEITAGIKAIVTTIRARAPEATIILTAIFPRNDRPDAWPIIRDVNANLARLADGRQVRYLDINHRLADAEGRLFPGMMDPDKLHPTIKTYQIWADALKPIFYELLGPPAKEDQAPPPTGNPAARR